MSVVAPETWRASPVPSHNVVEGDPQTRSLDLHASYQGGVSMNFWDCTAGSFYWDFAHDEMVQILEGEVHVTFEDGLTRTLGAGDTAHFQAGTRLFWEVPDYVRKLAFHRSPQSLPDRALNKALRLARRLPPFERRRTRR